MKIGSLSSLLLFIFFLDCSGFVRQTYRFKPTFLRSFEDRKRRLCEKIEQTVAEGKDPEEWIQKLEAIDTSVAPNRLPIFLGEWHVHYTDAPPPSNGQLGPFQGTAEQMIQDESTRSYRNLLKVPPGDWLSAVLDGVWEEWDGKLLDGESSGASSSKTDWGATHWKVTFKQLQISLFGNPIFTKQFPPETSRVWRTTFLDSNVRIVRAGKTGRKDDEYVFYTKRTPKA